MNNHPARERAQGKPSRPPYEDGIPDDEISMEADDRAENEGAKTSATPSVRPISREAAERGSAAEPDPDDPVSP